MLFRSREVDPANATRYAANAEATVARIMALDGELRTTLAPVKTVPFVVFHDGYQYLEARYGLTAVGSVTVSPERTPGARRLGEVRRKIERLNAACVFAEPQFDNALVATVLCLLIGFPTAYFIATRPAAARTAPVRVPAGAKACEGNGGGGGTLPCCSGGAFRYCCASPCVYASNASGSAGSPPMLAAGMMRSDE